MIQRVRAECVERDGYCVFAWWSVAHRMPRVVGACDGRSEWMHIEKHKRFKTRGMEPTERHTAVGSMMGCERHHDMYDSGEIRLTLTEAGAHGPIRVETDAGVYVIPARAIS